MVHKLDFLLNGQPVSIQIEPHLTLLEVLRDHLGMVGTKEGCGTGDCGACTVLVDGAPICSCLLLAVEIEGQHITTVEGLSNGDELHPLQSAFIEHGNRLHSHDETFPYSCWEAKLRRRWFLSRVNATQERVHPKRLPVLSCGVPGGSDDPTRLQQECYQKAPALAMRVLNWSVLAQLRLAR